MLFVVSCTSTEQRELAKTKAGQYLDNSQSNAYSETDREKYIDSAYFELNSSFQNDSITRYLYKRTLAAYYNAGEYDKSLIVGKDVLNMALEVKDTLEMANIMYRMGDTFYAKSKIDTAFYYYDQAQKFYEKIHEKGDLGEVILYKAYIYYNIGEYVFAEVEGIKALEKLQNSNKPTQVYNCYNLIASALDGQNSNTEAINYYRKALNQVDKLRQEGYGDGMIRYNKATCYNNMGGVYVKEGKNKEAISLYKIALNFPNIRKDYPSLYAKLLNNIAYAKFKANDERELPELFYESLEIRDSLDNQSGIVASNIHLGEYFASKKDTAKAISYLKSAYRTAKRIRSHYDILNSLKLLSELDKENGIYFSNRYIKVNDSLQEIARTNKEKYARIEYETDKLIDEKEELVKKNSFIIGVSAVILLFIAAIFIIYYLNSRNKELLLIQEQQLANEEIYHLMQEEQAKIDTARKDEKDRIAMELHDGILNNIYAVRLNLEFSNKKIDEESIAKRKEFIKELQTIETEIRAISHDLSKNAMLQQEKSFEYALEYMVTSQKNDYDTLFEAEIEKDIDWENLPSTCKVNVYRIIQETLQNINKYSQANYAKVEIKQVNNHMEIIVTDDGVGFDVNNKMKGGGIGIKNLKKRAAALNGSIEIDSEPGEGTTIKVTFPL